MKEMIKTVILTILVFTSILFTWNIWTYQPNYDPIENAKTVPEVSLSEQRDERQIVKPERLFFHQSNSHYGTVDIVEIDQIIKEIGQWNFDHFDNVSSQFVNVNEFLYESGHVEIVFPDVIPMEIYRRIINVKDSDALTIQFDRIVIDIEPVTKDTGFVYFVSLDQKQVYRSQVAASFIANFSQNYYETVANNKKFGTYTLEALSDTRSILVQTDEVSLHKYKYLYDQLPAEKFRDALFSDPSFVQRSTTNSGEEFTDSSTLLNINFDTNTIFYVNPAQEQNMQTSSINLLKRSIDFVNAHGGWTGNYYFVGMDETENTVLFRLYTNNGYPIFNNNGMSEILQIWGGDEIYQYIRNNFLLDRLAESSVVTLASGVETLEYLKSMDNFKLEFLQELAIGFELTRDLRGPLVHLEPAWFYKYNDQWWMIPANKGGTDLGVE